MLVVYYLFKIIASSEVRKALYALQYKHKSDLQER